LRFGVELEAREDLDDGSWFCEIEAAGRGLDGADDLRCAGCIVEAGCVGGCELKAVEQYGRAFRVDAIGGEGIDDD